MKTLVTSRESTIKQILKCDPKQHKHRKGICESSQGLRQNRVLLSQTAAWQVLIEVEICMRTSACRRTRSGYTTTHALRHLRDSHVSPLALSTSTVFD